MSQLTAFSDEFRTIYLLASPLSCVNRRILIQLFPPNSVVCIVQSNVGEDRVRLGASQSVRVGVVIGTRSNTEETILRIDRIQSAVLARLHPSDVVADCEYLIAILLITLRRDQHSQIGLTASRRESSSDILGFAVRLLNAQDQHVFSHPAFVLALEGSDTQSEALLAQQNVAAVSGVDGPDRVFFRELYDITLFRINICLGVQTTNEVVGGVTQILKCICTHTSHDVHVQNNIDGVSQLNANLCQRRTDRAHRIRDHVHGSALHYAVIQRNELCLHFFRIHPVVGRTCTFLCLRADKGTILYTSNVVRKCAMIQTARQLVRIQLVHLVMIAFRQRSYFFCQCIQLFFRTVDPYDLSRLCQSDHFVNPLQHILVVSQCHWYYLLIICSNLIACFFWGTSCKILQHFYYTQIRLSCQAVSAKSH